MYIYIYVACMDSRMTFEFQVGIQWIPKIELGIFLEITIRYYKLL